MSEPFAIGTFSRDGERFPGPVVGERVHGLRPALGDGVTTRALLDDWAASFARVRDVVAGDLGDGTAMTDLRVDVPIDPPGQVRCARANYRRAPLSAGEIVWLRLGHDEHFATGRYWDDFPGLGAAATRRLIGCGTKVIGTDAPGLDRGNPHMAPGWRATGDDSLLSEAHRAGVGREYSQVEKLRNLGALPARGFSVSRLPMKIASAGWRRAVAILGLEG